MQLDPRLLEIAENQLSAEELISDSRSSQANRVLAEDAIRKVIPCKLLSMGYRMGDPEYKQALNEAKEIRELQKDQPLAFLAKMKMIVTQALMF
jgi:hypothetical protein